MKVKEELKRTYTLDSTDVARLVTDIMRTIHDVRLGRGDLPECVGLMLQKHFGSVASQACKEHAAVVVNEKLKELEAEYQTARRRITQ